MLIHPRVVSFGRETLSKAGFLPIHRSGGRSRNGIRKVKPTTSFLITLRRKASSDASCDLPVLLAAVAQRTVVFLHVPVQAGFGREQILQQTVRRPTRSERIWIMRGNYRGEVILNLFKIVSVRPVNVFNLQRVFQPEKAMNMPYKTIVMQRQ